jgi:hypothetical protein
MISGKTLPEKRPRFSLSLLQAGPFLKKDMTQLQGLAPLFFQQDG